MKSNVTILRIDPMSAAKVMGVLYCAIGIIMAIFFAIAAMTSRQPAPGGMVLAILFPVLYAIGGFIGGLLMAFLYNLAAGAVGGIVLDLHEYRYEES